ncbi:hypothetical protein Tco_0616122 [Tanacetum coccineum]
MAQLKYCDKHNQVGFLRKPDESAGFAEIVDFLRGSNLRYALTTNPTIYDSLVKQFWQSATANTKADGTLEIKATIDTIRYTISEASIRESLQLADATGITMLPNDELFEGMGQIGYPTDGTFTFWKSFFTPQWRFLVHHLLHCISSKSGGWDQFGSNIATALICLSTDSERGATEVQGRKSQDDPLDSSVHGLVILLHKVNTTSGEEQVEEISLNTLEAAKTLSKVASLKPSIKVSTVSEQLSTGNEQVSTVGAEKSTSSQDKGQREGKLIC